MPRYRVTRVYEIDAMDMTAAQFISVVDIALINTTGEGLEELTDEAAACAVTDFYDQGDFTDWVGIMDVKFEVLPDGPPLTLIELTGQELPPEAEPLVIKSYNDKPRVIDPCKSCGESLSDCMARDDMPTRDQYCCEECDH